MGEIRPDSSGAFMAENDADPMTAVVERRKAFRYSCILQAARGGEAALPFKPTRLARVLNLSTGGIALHSGEPYEVGTLLAIQLHAPTGEPISSVLDVRVVRADEQANSTWVLGAAFASELSEIELETLLS